MPLLTRRFLKASFLYLFLSLIISVGVTAGPSWGWALPNLTPVFFHFFMVGWVTQIIFGIAYWMLPKYSRQRPHRSERLAWTVFALLNAGLLMRGLAEPMISLSTSSVWPGLLMSSAVLQWLAGLGFVINSWKRV